LHPCYLDSKGLVALWREALLAQKVLQGITKGYKKHPQLRRFKKSANPVGAIANYLAHIASEAEERNYSFNRAKIEAETFEGTIEVNLGQMNYEMEHLLGKLAKRAPAVYQSLKTIEVVRPHPLFKVIDGGVEDWEVVGENLT
jgi:hypothetical protein